MALRSTPACPDEKRGGEHPDGEGGNEQAVGPSDGGGGAERAAAGGAVAEFLSE
jgi:hypothetical protein